MNKIAACIGGGVIGGGWVARFLLHGWDVRLFDPAPDAERKVNEVIANARRALPALADVPMPAEGTLTLCSTLEEAVSEAQWIQESVPERLELKHKVMASIQAACRSDAIIGSSTSGFKPSELQENAANPGQIMVAHPFNPVYLVPLVEVVPSQACSPYQVTSAKQILDGIGMKPLVVRKEIDAHIADRLLEAVWREGLWLIKDDIATTEEIDDAIRFGFGLRWAQMGLFETYRIAGGEAGMAHFIGQFGPALAWPWTKLMDVPELTDELIQKIADQSDAQSGMYDLRQLEQIRDDNLVGIMRVQKNADWGVGAMLREHDQRLKAMSPAQAQPEISAEPLQMFSGKVLPAWIDYNGHMNEANYLRVFSDATDNFMAFIGVNDAYIQAGQSYYTVETHIRHLDDIKLGQGIEVRTQLISQSAKKMHLFHFMYNRETGALIATGEHMLLHVDINAGKTCPATDYVQTRLTAIFDSHSDLAVPEGAGNAIGKK
ncbi:carnitine 3-dehydrogenase [Aliamphritea ceti]|uniref:carnitine 3-dehydrogenase n=1 Tax=Aliamphritea ceti TaxID=1524258 RepID=UPI0021C358D8|nr:carnitine 3-dehydrogenase [Aliamphritea ceti]